MKKFLTMLAVIIFSVCLLISCSSSRTYDDGFEDGYDIGYSDARFEYEDDFAKGFIEGENSIAGDIDWISVEIRNEYGIDPEEAVYILESYMYDPNSVSYTEMCDSIYAIRKYYFDVYDIIQN
jgi:hypothetical protein